ncbi:hypothetical protein [Demequina maris]|uniref:hypothetical protein n=1 Tax=Demequina maris TaxID=1638982 RepID=UPI0007830B8A|nr:hypothetical protein [Demequina maris]
MIDSASDSAGFGHGEDTYLRSLLEQAVSGEPGWQVDAGATAFLEFDTGWIAAWGDPEQGGLLHRTDGPAAIDFREGESVTFQFREHGVLHRVDGPAVVHYDAHGTVQHKEWWREGEFMAGTGMAA